jgi:hypothetical protein
MEGWSVILVGDGGKSDMRQCRRKRKAERKDKKGRLEGKV